MPVKSTQSPQPRPTWGSPCSERCFLQKHRLQDRSGLLKERLSSVTLWLCANSRVPTQGHARSTEWKRGALGFRCSESSREADTDTDWAGQGLSQGRLPGG